MNPLRALLPLFLGGLLTGCAAVPDPAPDLGTAQEGSYILMNAYRMARVPTLGDLLAAYDAAPLEHSDERPFSFTSVRGFCAARLETCPEELEDFLSIAPKLRHPELREMMFGALTDVGTAPALAAAAQLRTSADPAAHVAEPPPSRSMEERFRETPAPAFLDYFWGAFFATGDPARLTPIIDAALPPQEGQTFDITQAVARWSLASVAKTHPLVRETLCRRLETAPAEAREAFRAMLNPPSTESRP